MSDKPSIDSIFCSAIEIESPDERRALVARACGEDVDLKHQVERLLHAHFHGRSILDAPPQPVGTVDGPLTEQTGTVIGAYKLLEQIGEGGMGMVWMAQQTEPVRRVVALKLIKAGMDSKQVIARFEAERQALALMDHPNIARILDGGTTPSGRPYFVMDVVKGVPITKYCDEHYLTPRQRLELFIPVCQTVQHAHQKGVVHRDLKPSNVLVALYDGNPAPKVIDFGVAKAVGQTLTEKTLITGFGTLVGTLEYMSPEQAEVNQLDIDTRSDIYALGVLLYELLTGTTPLEHQRVKEAGLLEALRIIREEETPRPSTRLSTAEELPTIAANRGTEPKKLSALFRGELDWILMKALEKDRNRRYETANGFAMDVQRYLADEPVLACPPSAGYRLRKFARRNKGRLAVAAGVFLAATVMAASIGWAVRDHAARLATVEGHVRDSLNTARILITENKLASAREKLAQARAQLGNDWSALGHLAAEVAASEVQLDRFQQFQDLIERAHEAETAPLLEPALAADGSDDRAAAPLLAGSKGRRPAAAVPFVLEALRLYDVLERDDWTSTLGGDLLGRPQVEQVRRLAYEELLWLASDVVLRQQEHRLGRTLSPEEAAQQALVYLGRAESAHRPTPALYGLRARCRTALGEEAAAQADAQRAVQTPPTMAFDHFLRAQEAYDAGQLAEGVQACEAALRLEPTHYWSMMRWGVVLCDLGEGPQDWAAAARVLTGCILKRPDHAHAYHCRANAYSKLLRYEDSAADYSKAIELDPTHMHAWYSRGSVYSHLGRSDEAVADLSKAIELDPMLVIAWNNRGAAYDKLGQPDKALADFSRAVDLDPKHVAAWVNRGVAYNRLGQHDKAVGATSKAIELDPKCAPAWSTRGRAHNSLGQPDKALADFSRAVELDPKDVAAWYSRGSVYIQLGQPDKAVADLSNAVELDPKLTKAWVNRGAAYRTLGQPDKALADFSKAVDLDPKHMGAWYNRGSAYIQLGQHDKAVADLSMAVELDPRYAPAWNNRGNAYYRQGQLGEAVADYSKAIELDPQLANAWVSRGHTYDRLGQQDKAVADLSRAIELDPKRSRAWSNRGVAYSKMGQFGKAVADLSRAVELDPMYALAWYNRGQTYDKLGQADKAIVDLSTAIELAPNDPQLVQAYLLRAQAHGRLAHFDEARADYEAFLKRAPNHAGAHNALAWLLATCPDAKLRDPDQAVELAKKAVQLAPKAGNCWTTLGVAHYRAGDWKASVAALDKFRDLRRGGEAVDGLLLAMAHRKLGNPDEARKAYEQAIQWLEKNKETLEKDKDRADELGRLQAEAEEVLELKKK